MTAIFVSSVPVPWGLPVITVTWICVGVVRAPTRVPRTVGVTRCQGSTGVVAVLMDTLLMLT